MTLDDLNARVTQAILEAESLPPNSAAASAAYQRVLLHEVAIAGLTPPTSADGVAARLGAVTAALRAGEALRALALATFYAEQAVPPRAEEELRRLIATAEHSVSSGVVDPLVKPVTFEFATAA